MNNLATTRTPGEHTPPNFQNCSILNHQEAKSRLSKLSPSNEEHSKLQDALIKTAGIVEISLPNTSYKVNTSSHNCQLLGGFGSSEHVAIGNAVRLFGLPENSALLVKGVTSVQFGHIVALAGDVYAVVDGAISLLGGDDLAKTKRFKDAFATLANANNDQVRKLVDELNSESQAVENSSLPHHCYSNQMIERTKRMKAIKGDIDALMLDNSDHFFKEAKDAYRIGHSYAMRIAAEAGVQKNLEGLKLAYALDAFACHFLTDLFAAGHIRNQRGELELFLINRLGFSESKAKPLAGILTGAQHEKDGDFGLNVANARGDHWRAFGDGNFFTSKNAINRNKVIEATQQSVKEIYNAYLNSTDLNPSVVHQLIPFPTSFNPPPIYSLDETSLFLHDESDTKEIHTKWDYLNLCIPQAIRYLPQEYIDGVLKLDIEISPVLNKVFVPLIERVTGSVWHVVGISTYNQVKKESHEVNKKIEEIGDILNETHKISLKLLEQMNILDAKIDHLLWANSFQPIKTPIDSIKNIVFQLNNFSLQEKQYRQMALKLWDELGKISYAFSNVAEFNPLLAYQERLEKSDINRDDIKICMTLWFQQMLSYQAKAFALYASIQFPRNNTEENLILQRQAMQFEIIARKQIEIHKDHIDETLIYENECYITQQIEKKKTNRIEFFVIEEK